MRKTLIAFSVAAALGASAWAFAQEAVPQPPAPPAPGESPLFEKLDTNHDGAISKAEAKADPKLAAKFDTLDKNKDGKLTPDELPQRHWKRGPDGRDGRGMGPGGPFGRADTDHDGRISKAEATVAGGKLAEDFDKLDLNHDGYLDKADMELRHKQMRDAWFDKADTNHDGALSKAEFEAAPPMGPPPGMGPGGPGKHHRGPGRDKDAPPPPPGGEGDMPPPAPDAKGGN